MKVLIGCEFSGIVREAFAAKGHDAWSCDLLDTEIPGQHIQEDIITHLIQTGIGYYNLIIVHPDCTFIANSGVIWMMNKDGTIKDYGRWQNMINACLFFNVFDRFAEKVVKENPIPHRYAITLIGKYNQIIHPWQFGHTTMKGTCLWLKNLPPLIYTYEVPKHIRTDEIYKEPPGPDRKKNRSRTFTRIAEAMAEQWG